MMGPMNMSEKQIWKFAGIVATVAFLAGVGAMVALSNMMGWY